MTTIKIPKEYIPGFRSLTEMPGEKAERLLEEIAKLGEYGDVESLGSSIASAVGIEKEASLSILRMLISLNQQEGLLRNESYEDISEGLVRGCKAEKIQGEKYDWDRLKNFFLKYFLLGPNNLKIFARASVVSQRRGKIMTDTEILTDIRPISLNGHAYGSVILQTLRIEHLDRAVRNDATLQVYFALDGDDLRRLRDQIDGALRTELDLTEMLKGTELYSLTHSSEE